MEARGGSDDDDISQKGRSERLLSDGAICGLIGEAEAVVARDGNLNPTRGYPVRLDPNRPDFTRSDKL